MSEFYRKIDDYGIPIQINYTNAKTAANHIFSLDLSDTPLKLDNHKIALEKVDIYNAIPNIHSTYNNTDFYYQFSSDGTTITSNNLVDLFQGYTGVTGAMMDYNAINSVLESYMITNNHYLLDTLGNKFFFLKISADSSYNKIVFEALRLPTEADLTTVGNTYYNFKHPSGQSTWLPSVRCTMRINIVRSGSATLLGFPAALYPSTFQTSGDYYELSPNIPQSANVIGLVLKCNLCMNSPVSTISNYLRTVTINAAPGEHISYEPSNLTWIRCARNESVRNITITICDQNGTPLTTLIENFTTAFSILIREMKNRDYDAM